MLKPPEGKRIEDSLDKAQSLGADLFCAFSRKTPLLILYALHRRGRTLAEISKIVKMPQKAVLPELALLQDRDILVSFGKRQKTCYRLADNRVLQAIELIHKISKKKTKQDGMIAAAPKKSRISRKRQSR